VIDDILGYDYLPMIFVIGPGDYKIDQKEETWRGEYQEYQMIFYCFAALQGLFLSWGRGFCKIGDPEHLIDSVIR
jgi:hypothetical protein